MMTNIEKLQGMMETVKDDKEMVARITKVIPKVVSAYYTFVENVTDELSDSEHAPFDTKVSIERCKKEFIKTIVDILENFFSTSKDKILFNSAIVLAKPYIDVFLDLEISTIEAISKGKCSPSIASSMFGYTSEKLSETLNEMLEAAMNFEEVTAEDRFVKAVCDDYEKDLEIVEDMIKDAKDDCEWVKDKCNSDDTEVEVAKKYLDSLQEKKDDIMTNRHEFLKEHGKHETKLC